MMMLTVGMMPSKYPYRIKAHRGDAEEWRRLLDDALIRATPESPIISRQGRQRSKILDMRIPLTNGVRAGWIGEHLAWALRGGFFDARAVASSGVPGTLAVGAVLARLPDMEACIVRPERKDYGRCRIVEGARPESVVFIDDILSGANTSLRAIGLLEEEGIRVEGVLTIVCYGWGRGAGRLASAGVKAAHLVHLSRRFKPSRDMPEDVFEQINRNPARIARSVQVGRNKPLRHPFSPLRTSPEGARMSLSFSRKASA